MGTDDDNGTAEQPQVVAPQPSPTTFGVNIARIPNGLKGETLQLVLLDIHTVVGQIRLFLEPDTALDISRMLAVAARETRGKIVVPTPAQSKIISTARKN